MNSQEQAGVFGDPMIAFQHRFGPQLEQARHTMSLWNRRAVALMREHPGASLLCAVGLGFFVGRLASRR